MSISRQMDKRSVVHICNGLLLSHKKEYILISSNEVDETEAYYTKWSKPERETPIQYTNIYMEFRKKLTITLYARQQKRHRCIEQSFGFCGEDKGGMIWENSIETCILSYVKQIASPGSMHELRAGALGWPWGMGWWKRWEWGSGWGTHVHPWLIHVNAWQNHYNIVKQLAFN